MADLFRTRRERRLWIAAVLWLFAVYGSAAFVRAPTEFLRERNLLRLTVAAVFVAVAVVVAAWCARRRPGPREWAALAAAGLVYLVALTAIERHEERFHLLQFGVFGGLVFQALRDRAGAESRSSGAGRATAAIVALVATALAGWGDEGIQGRLPERVYELRDVALNAWAGLLVVSVMVAVEVARSRDRRAP